MSAYFVFPNNSRGKNVNVLKGLKILYRNYSSLGRKDILTGEKSTPPHWGEITPHWGGPTSQLGEITPH